MKGTVEEEGEGERGMCEGERGWSVHIHVHIHICFFLLRT